MLFLLYSLLFIVITLSLLSLRLFAVLIATHSRSPKIRKASKEKATIALLLGSGGHTAEIFRLIAGVNWNRYSTRIYIVTAGDTMSVNRALEFEKTIDSGQFQIITIPRARYVHQSYLTSPFTTLNCLWSCLYQITIRPLFSSQGRLADVILLNGPGSCVPIVLAAFLPKIFWLESPSIVYIESFARLTKLSFSGRLVRPFVNRFFVQWKGLRDNLTKKENSRDPKLRAKIEYQGWLV